MVYKFTKSLNLYVEVEVPWCVYGIDSMRHSYSLYRLYLIFKFHCPKLTCKGFLLCICIDNLSNELGCNKTLLTDSSLINVARLTIGLSILYRLFSVTYPCLTVEYFNSLYLSICTLGWIKSLIWSNLLKWCD